MDRKRLEEMKMEIAGELGLGELVHRGGWAYLPSEECGRLGGLISRRAAKEKKQGREESQTPPGWGDPPPLFGGEVHLRPFLKEDCKERVSWILDPQVQEALYGNALPALTRDSHRREVRRWYQFVQQDPASLHWAIEVGGRVVGDLDLYGLDRLGRWGRVHILIGLPLLWRKKIGTEAMGALIKYAFGQLGLVELYADLPSFNLRARSFFSKLGYLPAGERRLPGWVFESCRYTQSQWRESLRLGQPGEGV